MATSGEFTQEELEQIVQACTTIQRAGNRFLKVWEPEQLRTLLVDIIRAAKALRYDKEQEERARAQH